MAKRVVLNRIKKNQSYTVAELATVTCVSELSIRRWIEEGMKAIDTCRPTLIMGFSALSFLRSRQSKAKQPMKLDELYCLRCKTPRAPLGRMADYISQSAAGGRLVALCAVCECSCNRNISASQLPAFERVLDIVKRAS